MVVLAVCKSEAVAVAPRAVLRHLRASIVSHRVGHFVDEAKEQPLAEVELKGLRRAQAQALPCVRRPTSQQRKEASCTW